MLNRYRTRLLLTSLLLCSLCGAAPRAVVTPPCSGLRNLYAPRLLREVRARLLLAYARAHVRRAQVVLRILAGQGAPRDLAAPDKRLLLPQETADHRMKHLTESIAARCMPR